MACGRPGPVGLNAQANAAKGFSRERGSATRRGHKMAAPSASETITNGKSATWAAAKVKTSRALNDVISLYLLSSI